MTATAMVMAPGETLGGYRILEVVAIGGMAIVYRAEQLSLGRQVALKVLSPELSRDEAFRERFRREGKHVASLEHPHVVTVYDSGEVEGRLFLAMRFVDGSTLAERMRDGALPAHETLSILRPIGEALDAAHAVGVVHRDVKPQNILISDRGYPYLADFGIAKGAQTHGLTVVGGFVGSVNYAAPEQVLGKPTAPATDVYALAAVLYQCATGQVPYPRDTDAGVLHAQVHEPPPALRHPDAAAFNAVIARGMAKDAAGRYPAASELIAAAAEALGPVRAASAGRAPTFSVEEARGSQSEQPGTPATIPPVSEQTPATVVPVLGPEAAPGGSSERMSRTEIVPPGDRVAPSDATAADLRRARPEPPEPPVRQGRRNRRWVAALAGGAVVLVGVVALVIALTAGSGSGRSARAGALTPPRVARAGALSIAYRLPWAPASATADGSIVFTGSSTSATTAAPISLGAGGVTLTAGPVLASAAIPGALPPSLLAHFGRASGRPARIAGGVAAVRYAWAPSASHAVNVWVIPAAAGDIALLCSGPAAQMSSCAALAQAARVDAAVLSPGPDTTLAANLRRVLASAAAARPGIARLRGAQLPGPAAALQLIAARDATAAAALRRLAVPSRYREVVAGLAGALAGESQALSTAARAAGARNRNGYVSASRAVAAASRRAATASRAIAAADLLAAPLGQISVPVLPAPHPEPTPSVSVPSTPAPTTPASAPATTYSPPAPTYTPPTAPVHPAPRSSSPKTVIAKPLS